MIHWSDEPTPLPFTTPTHGDIIRLRAALHGARQTSGALQVENSILAHQVATLQAENKALRLQVKRGSIGWGERAACGVIAAWDRVIAFRDPHHRITPPEAVAILAVILACLGIVIRLGA